MPTTSLVANSIGSFNVWTNAGGATKMASVASPDDDDTSYVVTTGTVGSGRMSFFVTSLPSPAFAVESHILRSRVRRATTGTLTNCDAFLSNGSGANITAGAAAQPGLTYANRTDSNLAMPAGVAMTVANINAMEIGVHAGGGTEEERCTTLYWDVTWHATNGGFVFLVCELLGPVFGSAILLKDVLRIRTALARAARRTTLTDDEVSRMLSGFREYRWTRYFDLASA